MPFATDRRTALGLAALLTAAPAAATAPSRPTTWLVCHGAWSAGWSWKKMRPLLHNPPASTLSVPTYTGLGDRAHLASPLTGLEVHIRDVIAHVEMEDLTDITLIGHSYGGMVATGVADRIRDRIRRLIYLDAFLPNDGECLYDLTGQKVAPGDPWLAPPAGIPADTSPADRAWIEARRMPQPRIAFTEKLRLSGTDPMIPRAYVRCTRTLPGDPLKGSAERARANAANGNWRYVEIDASHSPQVTAPELLARTLGALT